MSVLEIFLPQQARCIPRCLGRFAVKRIAPEPLQTQARVPIPSRCLRMHRLAGPIERQADTHNPLGPVVSQLPIEQRGDPDRNEISQLWGVYLPARPRPSSSCSDVQL